MMKLMSVSLAYAMSQSVTLAGLSKCCKNTNTIGCLVVSWVLMEWNRISMMESMMALAVQHGRQDQNHHKASAESIGDDCRCESNSNGAEYMSRSSELAASWVKLRSMESENGRAKDGPSGLQLGSGTRKSRSNAIVWLDGGSDGSSGSIQG